VVGVKDGKHVRYEHNGAIYISKTELVQRGEIVGGWTQFYVMPPERSIDIDTPEDLAEARRLAGDG
jgi:CMP-N-acetylneuraminic acid synthetase